MTAVANWYHKYVGVALELNRNQPKHNQFGRTNSLHVFNGKPMIVYKMFLMLVDGQPISNPYFKL